MTVGLPSDPRPASAVPAYLDAGGIIRSPLGGVGQRLNRLGDRWALDVTMPPLVYADLGRLWIARLIRGQREGVRMQFPQPIAGATVPTAASVDGTATGTILPVRGGAPGYPVFEGQFIHISTTRWRLHQVTADTTIGSDGKAVLAVQPMIRELPADGTGVEIGATPTIEGYLEGDERSWTLDAALMAGLSFRIVEW